jgi:hypothetical protein
VSAHAGRDAKSGAVDAASLDFLRLGGEVKVVYFTRTQLLPSSDGS